MDEFPKQGSSSSGTTHAWQVEARSSIGARDCGGFLLDEKWKPIPLKIVPAGFPGVPGGSMFDEATSMGLLPYASAQALRWWFLAEMNRGLNDIGVETRLVRFEVKYEKRCTAINEHDVIGNYRQNNYGTVRRPSKEGDAMGDQR